MLLKTMKLLTCLILLWVNIIGATVAYRLAISNVEPVWLTPQQIEDVSEVL